MGDGLRLRVLFEEKLELIGVVGWGLAGARGAEVDGGAVVEGF